MLMTSTLLQGGSAVDSLLHAGHGPHPAGVLLLHRAAAGGGGASPEEPGAPPGEQDPAATGHAAGKDLPAVMVGCWWSDLLGHGVFHTEESSWEF